MTMLADTTLSTWTKYWRVLIAFLPVVIAVAVAAPAGAGTTATSNQWAYEPTPSPSTGAFSGVSCRSSVACVAVGWAESSGVSSEAPLEESWNGGPWSMNVTSQQNSNLSGVSCWAPHDCVAVGYVTSTNSPLALTWNGRVWRDVPIAGVPGAYKTGFLSGVSCVSAIACTAVGSYEETSSSPAAPLAEQWNGTSWSVTLASPPPVPNIGSTALSGVSCPSAGYCVAVGAYVVPGQPMSPWAEVWNGRTWSQSPVSNSAGGTVYAGALNGVSCTSVTSCVAVGYTDIYWYGRTPLADVWNGSTWQVEHPPLGAPAGPTGVLTAVSCPAPGWCTAVGYQPDQYGQPQNVGLFETRTGRYWTMQLPANPGAGFAGVSCSSPGECTAVGGGYATVAFRYASPPSVTPVTGVATSDGGSRYWLVRSDGTVDDPSGAPWFGSAAGSPLPAPVVAIAATPDGGGYRLVTANGQTRCFGDAKNFGSTASNLNSPIVGLAATADGRGYWMAAADGGVFAFGDARFHGSMGYHHLNSPIVGMAADFATGGYWLVAADGGIFAFDARFHGSAGSLHLRRPIVGMEAAPDGSGYRFVASDGGVFDYGQRYWGSFGGQEISSPVVAIAGIPNSGGYWLVQANGTVTSFP